MPLIQHLTHAILGALDSAHPTNLNAQERDLKHKRKDEGRYDRHGTTQCLKHFGNGKTPYIVRFHPDDKKDHPGTPCVYHVVGADCPPLPQHEFGRHHPGIRPTPGPVNTITSVDKNRCFTTTSDSKASRAWDYHIPIVIKYITEPYAFHAGRHLASLESIHVSTWHAIPTHPAVQSLDNQTLVYGTCGSCLRTFHGHVQAIKDCHLLKQWRQVHQDWSMSQVLQQW